MNIPKINLLYYKELINACFILFFQNFNDYFIKQDNNYVLSKNIEYNQIKKTFKEYLANEIKKYITPYDITIPNYFFIIGSCMPKDNLFLKFKNNDFPEKLLKLINSDYQIKYILKEKDIKINFVKFNQVFIDIFNELFSDKKKILKLLGKQFINVFFITHKNLDCYTMFKVLKFIYGKNNCINLYKEKYKNSKSCLIAINDLIDKHIASKKIVCKSNEFKNIVNEVNLYLDLQMKECLNG